MRDVTLFERSLATLIESWDYLASGSPGAELRRVEGAAIGAFVRPPEREFLNNAVMRRPAVALETIAAIEETYASRGIERYAIWVHESETEAAVALRDRGYRLDSATRTMAMPVEALADLDFEAPAHLDRSAVEVEEVEPARLWAVDGPVGMTPNLDPARGHFYVARLAGEDVATLMAFDHEGDCGIYIVGTLEGARRRGIATALSAHAVAAARERGCITAGLQATPMAEGVYSRVGFRDLGLWREYIPADR
jgi:GNAT superfamily N-acetyltransferase